MSELHNLKTQLEALPEVQPSVQVPVQPLVQIAYLADNPEIIPLLAKWHHDQWGQLVDARTLEQRKTRLKHHLQREAIPTTCVAWVDGQPVGSTSLVADRLPELAEWTPWLANVYVLPAIRRHGIGVKLVQRVAAEAAHLGYPRLYLYTLDQMHLYESLGWQVSHVRFYRGHDMTVMARDLIVNPPPAIAELLFTPNSTPNPTPDSTLSQTTQ